MITTVDVETSYQKTENGGYDPSPFHPDNILVSVGINEEYYFTNHSERIDKGCYHHIQSILDKTTLLIGHNIKFDLMWLLESGFKYSGRVYDTMLGEYILNRGIRKSLLIETGDEFSVHLKIDTGMHRLGCPPEKFYDLYKKIVDSDLNL